jgi:DMSO/TMAO reductase YedYZ molybdopterin-dependent catalytic subunit
MYHELFPDSPIPNRRQFLASSVCAGAALVFGCGKGNPAHAGVSRLPAPYGDGRFVGIVPWAGRRRRGERLEVVYDEGRKGRFRQDLSRLNQASLITPNDRFYIRSRCPDLIDFSKPWEIQLHGQVRAPRRIGIQDILSRVGDMGVHLLECSGNGGSFGLLSAARWTGVPLLRFFEEMGIEGRSSRILVSGFDDHSSDVPMQAPNIGASWVFTLDQLAERGVFLATGMNGVELPKDHGYPVRLVVPGWYGCTCIKWVNEIEFVDETEPATAHMREYAGRTHQETIHELAADYAPATIDLAALPIRLEQWDVKGEPIYRVVGVIWGGDSTTDDLVIRFHDDSQFTPVQSYSHETNRTWCLFSHTWKPSRPGDYRIEMKIDDPSVRTRRLDDGRYIKSVKIEAV